MGIEYSPKISDFRANGILGLESVDFFDTLKLYFVVLKLSVYYIYNI